MRIIWTVVVALLLLVAPAAAQAQTAAAPATLKVLHWNVHHGGVGTDGKLDATRIATWIAKMNPDVASLNEVDTVAQMNAILTALKTKTGKTWTASFSGKGNIVISKHAKVNASKCVYPDGKRYAAHLGINVHGRDIQVWSTHLTVGGTKAATRSAEAKSLQTCASQWSEARILAGDYNMQPNSAEYKQAVVGYTDAWAAAKAKGLSKNYTGNCDGCTRNSRIDYVFTSNTATFLVMKSAQMVDTRDAAGVMPSDHKPLLVTYEVR